MNRNHQQAIDAAPGLVEEDASGRSSIISSRDSGGMFLRVVTPTAEERGRGSIDNSSSATTSATMPISGAATVPPTTTTSCLTEIVDLIVGGSNFTTSRTTLCSVPGSHMEAMFSGRHRAGALQTGDGSYFIDRDGRHFHHILNYLRSGAVITLPFNDSHKEELAIEADFYGLEGLVKAIRMPKMDILECLTKETLAQWEAEAKLRASFSNGEAKSFAKMDPFRGLDPLFPVAGQKEECSHVMPLKFDPKSKVLKKKDALFMNNIRITTSKKKGGPQAVTVNSLDEFKTNFNKEWPNILHRLQEVLLEEPVIAAGGSVLRALTASKGIRTAEWWRTQNAVRGTSDIDLFLYGCDKEEANRIARRIFYTLALDNEKWTVIRGRGVINLYEADTHVKIQIVLRIYDSPSEVLIGFDLDICCCAFDGRNIWVCPRWISAIQSGVNVLNPLHAWPNKPSYEFRLAKYAFRGYAVSVPGVNSGCIDYNMIHKSDIGKLKGLARFLKIASEMESAPPHTSRNFAMQANGRWRTTQTERPRTPREVTTLRGAEIETVSEELRLVEALDLSYDDDEAAMDNLVIPSVLVNEGGAWDFVSGAFGLSRNTRDQAWEEILDAGEEHPKFVARLLLDAWDTSKRSREYLNGQMDKYDLDNLYYSKVYKEEEKSRSS